MENDTVRAEGSPDKTGRQRNPSRRKSEQSRARYKDEFFKVEFLFAVNEIEYYAPTFESFWGT